MLESWKIAAFIGAILFLVSGLLPLISLSLFDFSYWLSLLNVYASLGQTVESGAGSVSVSAGSIGILLTIILYPIAVILGFVSVLKRGLALAAGILGIICWSGFLLALNELRFLQYIGLSVYLGFIGAIILIIAFALKPRPMAPQAPVAAAPPPPPPQ
jgi:hypothetical protein